MTDDIVARLRLYAQKQRETNSTVLGLLLSDSADEIERLRAIVEAWKVYSSRAERDIDTLRARVAELERFASELDASGRKNTEPAALRGTPSDGEASASEGYLNTGESVQTQKADG